MVQFLESNNFAIFFLLDKNFSSFEGNSSFLIEFHRRKILKKYKDQKVIDEFFEVFKHYNYDIEYNNHHSYDKLIKNGISDKNWFKEMPITNNFAIFAKPSFKI